MSKLDEVVAKKIGELELANLRMNWALEQYSGETKRLLAVVEAKDAEIADLKAQNSALVEAANEPLLPMDKVNGHARPH